MTYLYVSDFGAGETWLVESMEIALRDGENCIQVYRDECDGEWPSDVNNIVVYECDDPTDCPEEDGIIVARSVGIVVAERPDDVRDDGYSPSDDYHTYWPDGVDKLYDFEMQLTPHKQLLNILDAMTDDILNMSNDEILAEMKEDGVLPEKIIHAFDTIVDRARKEAQKRTTTQLT